MSVLNSPTAAKSLSASVLDLSVRQSRPSVGLNAPDSQSISRPSVRNLDVIAAETTKMPALRPVDNASTLWTAPTAHDVFAPHVVKLVRHAVFPTMAPTVLTQS